MTTKTENITSLNFDPDILGEEHNEDRLQSVPAATVVSKDEDCGIFIPVGSLAAAGWLGDAKITEIKITKTAKLTEGLFLKSAKMLILNSVPPYIRIKNQDLENPGQFVGWYYLEKDRFDKLKMDVCCEYLVLFLNDKNKPFHDKPIKVRFRNSAYWKFKIELDKTYASAEASFAKLTNSKNSSKSNKWRSLVVIDVKFEPQLVGTAPNQSNACGVAEMVKLTAGTFPSMFFGTSEQKSLVWSLVEAYTTFTPILDIAKQQQLAQRQQPRLVEAIVDDSDLVF